MKILFITNYPSPYRVDFFNCWGQLPDVELTVLFLERPENQKHRSSKWFHTEFSYFNAVFLYDKISIGNYVIYKDIFHWLQRKYDGIIFGGYTAPTYMIAMEYLQLHHIPYGIEIDGGLIKKDSFLRLTIKKYFLSSASFWFSSGKQASKYLAYYGADTDKIISYPFTSMTKENMDRALNTITTCNNNETDWCKKREECRQKAREFLNIKEPIMSLTIGQFIKRKGFDLLIDLLPRLDRTVGYYFIGGRPTPEIEKFIEDYSLDNVHIIDFKTPEELSVYFRAANLFVLPTRYDIWGLVIGEAMAYGLPVVTTDLCGAGLELVEEGKNGVLCHAGDQASLKSALDKIMKLDLNHLGFESYKRIQNYTIENMVLVHYDYFKSKGV